MIKELFKICASIICAIMILNSCTKEKELIDDSDKIPDITGEMGTLTDVDRNVYAWIGIGTQAWMGENLKTTKYNDGTSIPLDTNYSSWKNLSTPAYCFYNNDMEFADSNDYGALYNWYVIETEKLCPTGWHVPSGDEWYVLTNYLSVNGYNNIAGKALKAKYGWNNLGNGDDVYNFTALPGGYRSSVASNYSNYGISGNWWTATASEFDSVSAHSRFMIYGNIDSNKVNGSYDWKKMGLSVRCVRD